MNYNELEKQIVKHCAPTLARLKTASLFQFKFSDNAILKESIDEINSLLNKRDVYVEAMLCKNNTALLYTYRKNQLLADFKNQKTKKILARYGYNTNDVDTNISILKTKLQHSSCFPHEIGLFLGYPPDDVQGFIENKGNNCKYCGFWKVYCNEEETCCLFAKLKKSIDIYERVFSEGRSLEQLTVCA